MAFKVIQGDAVETMRGLSSASVDACITDPPYGTTACAWDTVIPFAPMWAELKRIVKPKGAIVLFGSQPFTSALVMSNPAMWKHQWVWDKAQSGSFHLAKYQPLKVTEDVIVFADGVVRYVPEMRQGPLRLKGNATRRNETMSGLKPFYFTVSDEYYPSNILDFPNCANKGEGLHPTQKPVDLLRYLVRTYTNAGDTVLDFTCGSGTTGVACEIEGRDSINIDSDGHYCEVSRARMMRAQGVGCDIPKRTKAYPPAPLFDTEASNELSLAIAV